MTSSKELFGRFEDLQLDLRNMSGIVQNGGAEVTYKEAEHFTENINKAINDLNKLKLDVLEFYGKG